MVRFFAASVLAITLSAGAAMADDCTAPGAAPSVPNGSSATKDEMIAGSQAVRTFQGNTQAYIDCLDAEEARLAEIDAKGDEAKKIMSQREALIVRHNAAVDELTRVAGEFNQAVRDYKAQQASAE